jgi:recombination associated protein RdgC
VFKEQQGEDEDRFDADVTIATGELGRLVPDLIEALGGEATPGESAGAPPARG